MENQENKTSEDKLEELLLTQAKELLQQSVDMDVVFRRLLKTYWKDKKMVGEISDSIQTNNETMESLRNEIKDRDSRVTKK